MFDMRSLVLSLLVAFALGSVGLGCGSSVEREDPRPEHERNMEPDELDQKIFVDAQQLQTLADDGAIIVDSRAPEVYEEGHFPGAINIHGGKPWKDDNGFLPPDEYESQQIARSYGLTRSKEIVIYADARSKRASRLAWTLEYLGHGKVSIYVPGYATLQTELEFEEQTEAPDLEDGDFVVSHREEINATDEEVKAAVEGERNAVLIDTRRESEYLGEEDRGDPRQGTIPNSVWYYWENVFTEDDTLRPKEELQQEFDENGILQDDAVLIAYCQTGTRSTFIYYVVRWLGQDDATNYDGSWVEWSRANADDYPVETPDEG